MVMFKMRRSIEKYEACGEKSSINFEFFNR